MEPERTVPVPFLTTGTPFRFPFQAFGRTVVQNRRRTKVARFVCCALMTLSYVFNINTSYLLNFAIHCNKMISFTSTLPVFFFSFPPASSDVAWPPHRAWFLPRSTCSSRWCAPVLSDESELERRQKTSTVTSTVSSSLPPLRASSFQSVPLAPCNTTPEQIK